MHTGLHSCALGIAALDSLEHIDGTDLWALDIILGGGWGCQYVEGGTSLGLEQAARKGS